MARALPAIVAVTPLIAGLAAASPARAAEAGDLIAFARDESGTGDHDIYVMEPDGSDPRPVISGPGNDIQPAWSPDGSMLAFTRFDGDSQSVFVANADGSGARLVGIGVEPTWCTNQRLVVVRDDQLVAVAPDGTNPVALAHGFQPTCALDGTRVAFAAPAAERVDIRVVNVDGTGLTAPLTSAGTDNLSPAWSPDGGRIAFVSDRDSGEHFDYNVYVMAADGSNETRLTDHADVEYSPSWSVDGTRIAFDRGPGRAGRSDIVVMDADGTDATAISTGGANDAWPSFRRSQPTISINDASVTETDGGIAALTLTLSRPVAVPVYVDVATANGTALSGYDYNERRLTVRIPAGVTERTIGVRTRADTLDEDDETFVVRLSNPLRATIGDGEGVVTIVDDDAPPALAIGDVEVTERDEQAIRVSFVVTLSAPSGRPVTVDFTTVDGSATIDDYAGRAGSLRFNPGITSRAVATTVKADLMDEPDENFFLRLTSPTFASLLDGEAMATILDNDAPPMLFVDDVTVTEADDTSVYAMVTVRPSVPSGYGITFSFATADGTAVAPADYFARSATTSVAPGAASRTFGIRVRPDQLAEGVEAFFLRISNATNASIADGEAVITIGDDDV